MKGNKKEILYYLICFLMVVRYLLPYYFVDNGSGLLSMIPILDNALIIVPLMLMVAMIAFDRFRLSRTDMLLILIYACLIFSTVLNRGEIESSIINTVQVIILCFAIKCVLQDESKIHALLHVVRDITLLIFIANVIVAIIYPRGIPRITNDVEFPYLLYGNVNMTIKFFFPGLICSVLLDAKKNKRISAPTIIFFVGYLFLCLRVYFMATGLCAMFFLVFWSVARPILSKRLKMYSLILLVCLLIFDLTIVVFQNQFVTGFSVSLFGKSPGFTGRDWLWSKCLQCIKEKFVFGYGALGLKPWEWKVGSPYGAHNYFLDVFFQRGIIGFVPMVVFLIRPVFLNVPERYRTEHYIMIGFAFSYYIMFLFEPFYQVERFHIPFFYVLNSLPELLLRKTDGSSSSRRLQKRGSAL